MKSTDFTQNETILEIIERVKKLKAKNTTFSDITDNEGNQYVDLVQEGGGVLGIALVGYTYVMEEAGIRFYSLAGTSAGAINTTLMSALGKINQKKSEKILEILANQNLFDFVDGPSFVRKFINKAIKKEGSIFWSIIFKGFRVFGVLKKNLGLNPGNSFKAWIEKHLENADAETLDKLEEIRHQIPEGLELPNPPRLALITSDITTHTKVELPKMSELYWNETPKVAEFVRASMSVPFFFYPFEKRNIPNSGQENDGKWDEYASYKGVVPSSVKFVDGGMLSNFPINIFHRKDGEVPRMPTFGARLSTYRKKSSNVNTLLSFSGAMISTMRQIYDLEFILKNPDYRQLICKIDADENFNWLDFNMRDDQKIALFNLGAERAIEFLEKFDWAAYKKVRTLKT